MAAKDVKPLKGAARQAMLESIAHWERMASGTPKEGETIGASQCALCKVFRVLSVIEGEDRYLVDCDGCPVRQYTGKHGCRGTPYRDVEDVFDSFEDDDLVIHSSEFRAAARKELAFLRRVAKAGGLAP